MKMAILLQMSAAEIIEKIKALPPAEQQEVRAFITKLPSPTPAQSHVSYAPREEMDKIADEVFTEYSDLFKKLAQ